MKKYLSIFLVFVLSLSLFPVTTVAAAEVVQSEVEFSDTETALEDEVIATDEDIQEYYSEMAMAAKKSKAIIVIPGIAGTALKKKNPDQLVWIWATNFRYLKCDDSGKSKYKIYPTTEGSLWPGITYGVFNLYKPICTRLEREFGSKYDVVFFPYDWRMSNTSTADQLNDFIENSKYREVILVAHSMGGLVASKYITSDVGQQKTNKLVTLGTPYLGAPRAVYVMETGDMFGVAKETIKDMAENFPAVYELMPQSKGFSKYVKKGGSVLDGYLKTTQFLKTLSWGEKSNGAAKAMFRTANSFNNTLYSGDTHIVNSGTVNTYKIYGTGLETIKTVSYDASGKYIGISTTNSGDETVLAASARCGSTTNIDSVRGVDHLELIKDTDALDKVVSFINGSPRAATPQREFLVNSRGWIEGLESSRLIKIDVAEEAAITLHTTDGFMVQEENDRLYVVYGDGERERVGTIWHLGDGKEYSLYDRGYELTIDILDGQEQTNLSVQYFDSGYYKRYIEYDDNGLYDVTRLSVSPFETMETHYEGVHPVAEVRSNEPGEIDMTIHPERILEEESLLDIKQGDLR